MFNIPSLSLKNIAYGLLGLTCIIAMIAPNLVLEKQAADFYASQKMAPIPDFEELVEEWPETAQLLAPTACDTGTSIMVTASPRAPHRQKSRSKAPDSDAGSWISDTSPEPSETSLYPPDPASTSLYSAARVKTDSDTVNGRKRSLDRHIPIRKRHTIWSLYLDHSIPYQSEIKNHPAEGAATSPSRSQQLSRPTERLRWPQPFPFDALTAGRLQPGPLVL